MQQRGCQYNFETGDDWKVKVISSINIINIIHVYIENEDCNSWSVLPFFFLKKRKEEAGYNYGIKYSY